MAKILLIDIENSPALGYFWEMYDTNIIEVLKDGYMLSFAFKWLHEKKVHTYALPDFKGYKSDPTNDEKLVEKLAELVSQADIVVGHNGDRHDLRYMNARLLVHGHTPPKPYKTIDTLKIARSKFKFLSNRLDDLGNVLGVGRKLAHTGKHLWFACMNGDKKAWKLMRKYNAQDVVLLERVYLKIRAWHTTHPNVNFVDRKLGACPKCGSTNIHRNGYHYSAHGEAQRYKCKDCAGWSLGPYEKLAQKIKIRS